MLSTILCSALVGACTECVSSIGVDQVRAVAFGDSITQASPGWVSMVAADSNWQTDNHGIGGTIMSQILDEIKATNLGEKTHATLLLGFNDSLKLGTPAPQMASFESDLRSALAILLANKMEIYVGTTMRLLTYPTDNPVIPYGSDAGQLAYSNLIKSVITSIGDSRIHVVDVNALFNPESDDFLPDNIHPNTKGNQKIAKIFESVIYSCSP